MPIYEYACDRCGHLFDVLQKMSEDPLSFCPECGADGLRKLLSAPAFRLKGSGWYETDFKSGNKRNLAGEPAGKDAGDGDKAGGKSGDKPAEKPAGKAADKAGGEGGKTAPAARPGKSGGSTGSRETA